MSIYTRTGDQGLTTLYFNGVAKRVHKSGKIFSLLGKLDQISVEIGNLIVSLREKDDELITDTVKILNEIQHNMIQISSYVMDDKYKVDLTLQVTKFEEFTDIFGSNLEPLKTFIVSGANVQEVNSHRIRCLVRNTERKLWSYKPDLVDVGTYLNRLSDFFFNLARYLSEKDVKYEKRLSK